MMEEATFDNTELEKLWSLRLRVLKVATALYEREERPVSEQEVFQAFKQRFPRVPVGNPASIGARMRELAFAPTYKRWYGMLLLRAETGRYFPNPSPLLKPFVPACQRSGSCMSCEDQPKCIHRALRGERGR
jgi:hypothetical protein